MVRYRIALALLIAASCAPPSATPAIPQVDRQAMAAHVAYLASDALEGRAPGSPGDEAARAYIADALKGIGAEPLFSSSYQQPLTADVKSGSAETANVGGVIRGTERPGEYIVYVAHHDHLGRCGADASGDDICNGAVDNASGVAALIELGRMFAADPPGRSVILLASAAEENGLIGARHFIAHPPVPLGSIYAAFGLDTVAARGFSEDVVIVGEGRTSLDPLIEAAARGQGREVARFEDEERVFERSDHFAFAEAGIAGLTVPGAFAPGEDSFQTGAYRRERYHKPADEPGSHIDYSGAAADVALAFAIGQAVGGLDERPRMLAEAR